MTETIFICSALVLCLGVVVYQVRLLSRLVEATEARSRQREIAYMRMIRDLHNRLSAKDLSGYLALRQEERPAGGMLLDRSDEAEALIEQAQRGIGAGSNGGPTWRPE